jgi:hypothetical protein
VTDPVVIMCAGRGTHEPMLILVYDGPIPVPESFDFYPRNSEMDLLCDRAKGGCGRAPRLTNARLRQLIDAVAVTPGRQFDISFADLIALLHRGSLRRLQAHRDLSFAWTGPENGTIPARHARQGDERRA